ncbi:MAG TPA: tagatose 1,6-diphosphate aldolase [Candidatus Limnocylindria bacterium]|jgi:tagatose 1,6-diphosphate aldolase|nr:tagatose 1,6-diphosphate aldolase [Candidatus Limnocylindria bacterium]
MAVQTKMRLSKGKVKGIDACADDRGIIRAAAMDQRGSLMREIGKQGGKATPESLTEFKTAVTKILTPYASAILMDPEYGLPALKERAPGTGVLLAYEKSGYDADPENRMPDVLEHWTVRRLVEAGADAIKVLIYYDPFDDPDVNDRKEAVIERIGAECAGNDVPLFVEPLAYRKGMDEKGLEFAKRKPDAVKAYMARFSEARFGIDVLKVEVPVNMAYVQGSKANKSGEIAYTKAEALRHFREAADAATKPFIYLSAGVSDEVYRESLGYAGEAGARFSGVLAGRATWLEGLPVYAKQGRPAFEAWLRDKGVKNIQMLNEVLDRVAKPWWTVYAGREAVAS